MALWRWRTQVGVGGGSTSPALRLASMAACPPPSRAGARAPPPRTLTPSLAAHPAPAGLALPLLFQPRETARFLLGGTALPTNVEHDQLMGLLAAGLLSGATSAWALKVGGRWEPAPSGAPAGAGWPDWQARAGVVCPPLAPLPAAPPQGSADAHTLDSDTSERLQLGLMGLAGAALGVHVMHGERARATVPRSRAGWAGSPACHSSAASCGPAPNTHTHTHTHTRPQAPA